MKKKTKTRKMRRRVAILTILLMLLNTVTSTLAAPDWSGTSDGYYGWSEHNKFLLEMYGTTNPDYALENFTVSKVTGNVAEWDQVVYCYNNGLAKPIVDPSKNLTYSVAPYDLSDWNDLTNGKKFFNIPSDENALTFIPKIVSCGYPHNEDLIERAKTVYNIPADQAEDFVRFSTQKAIWHCTDNSKLTFGKTDEEIKVSGNAQKLKIMGGEIITLATKAAPLANPELALYEASDKTYQNLLGTQFKSSKEIIISKTDMGGNPLEGATMNLYKSDANGKPDGAPIKTWVSKTTEEVLNIEAGKYLLEEFAAPTGYAKLTTMITFTVDNNGNVTVEKVEEFNGMVAVTQNGDEITIKNDVVKKHSVNVSKTDMGGNPLEGATMNLYKSDANGKPDGAPIKTWVSKTTEEVLNIEAGKYLLEESAAPTGYAKLTTMITFTVDNSGNVKVEKVEEFNGMVAVTQNGDEITIKNNVVMKHSVNVSKTDMGGKPLEGATMKLYKSDANGKPDVAPIKTWESKTTAEVLNVEAGKYLLEESAAPTGYAKLTTMITFTVDNSGNVKVEKVEEFNGMVAVTQTGDGITIKNNISGGTGGGSTGGGSTGGSTGGGSTGGGSTGGSTGGGSTGGGSTGGGSTGGGSTGGSTSGETTGKDSGTASGADKRTGGDVAKTSDTDILAYIALLLLSAMAASAARAKRKNQ